MPSWDGFKPISIEDLGQAPRGYYSIALTQESKERIYPEGNDPYDDSSKSAYRFYFSTPSGRGIGIFYIPGNSPEFEQLRVRLYNSESGTLYVRKDSSYFSPMLLHVDGIVSAGELAAAKSETRRTRQVEQDAEAAKRASALDAKGKSLSTGYVYHGIDEDGQNGSLFNSGALERGHAYFVSNFLVGGDGTTAGVITSLFRNPNYQLVDYVTQKVRGEVVAASQTGFGTVPVAVVIVGGNGPLRIPIILGLVDSISD